MRPLTLSSDACPLKVRLQSGSALDSPSGSGLGPLMPGLFASVAHSPAPRSSLMGG